MGATLEISEARKQLNSIDERLKEAHVIYVTRNGDRAFAVVDRQYLSAVMDTMEILSDPDTMEMLRQSLEDIRAGRLHSHADVEKALG
jgi:PHD/YefM family antitoxin component YafN of YafNO toxin-antitoxin module